MTLAKTLILASIFGGLAQTAVKSGHSSPPDKSAAPTTTQAAETFFNDVRAEIRRGLEHASSSRDIGSKELDGLVSLLESSSTKLK